MAGASNTVQTSTDLPSGRFPENRDEACSYCTKDDSKVLSVEFHKMNEETMRAISFCYVKERCYSFSSRTSSIFLASSLRASGSLSEISLSSSSLSLITYCREAIAKKS